MSMDDNDGQMIFGDLGGLKLPDIWLTGEKKPRNNRTQETCPDRGSNPGPLQDMRACYHLLFSSGRNYSLLWICKCTVRLDLWEKALMKKIHLNGFAFSWVCECLVRLSWEGNNFKHYTWMASLNCEFLNEQVDCFSEKTIYYIYYTRMAFHWCEYVNV